MSGKKRHALSGIFAGLIGLICALVLGALFYGTMVYQLAGEPGGRARAQTRASGTPAPLTQGAPAEALFPGALLSLDPAIAQQTGETAQDVFVGGQVCRVITRSYALEGGGTARALSATPAAYLERLSGRGVQMQLVTGYVLAGMDALCAAEGGVSLLAARDGDFIYLLEAQTDEQTLYALGASASLGK